MNNKLSIIMYHYVRDLNNSRYPNIKGLLSTDFENQLDYLSKYYDFVTMEDCLSSLKSDKSLPNNSLLLTFDDSYIDHFLTVFPILQRKGIQGSFFPPAKAIIENKVLDVNKIHFILASANKVENLIEDIFNQLNNYRKRFNLKSNKYYFSKFAINGRYDSKEIVFIKRLLQVGLDTKLRNLIVRNLFNKYVGIEEHVFSKELYMNIDQIKCLSRNGMFVGSHGYEHDWLNTYSEKEQRKQVESSIKFLEEIDVSTDDWVMCYPYGGYNNSLIKILKEKKCKIGLTTKVGIANLNKSNALTLERLNTNDFPKKRSSNKNIWVKKVIS
tara:strand:+ start:2993 stop:3973 length:981 start_codon:yes stop_codon:yes gene_type:complete